MSEHPPKKPLPDEKAELIAAGEPFWTDRAGVIHKELPKAADDTLSPAEWREREGSATFSGQGYLSPKEWREQLAQAVGELQERKVSTEEERVKEEGEKNAVQKSEYLRKMRPTALAEKAGVRAERDAMLEAERAYIDVRKRGVKGGDDAKALEEKYNALTLAYEKKLEERLAPRLGGKLMAHAKKKWEALKPEDRPKDADGKEISLRQFAFQEAVGKKERIESVVKRYRSMIASRDIIDRGEKQLEQGLSQKERSVFMKGLAWVGKQNQNLERKVGKQGARAIRVLTGAAIGTGVTAGLGVGVFALAGTFATRVLRSAGVVATGAVAGAGAGMLYEKTGGVRRAKQKLAHVRTTAASSTEDIRAKREAYRKGSKDSIARKRARVEAVVGILAGAGVSIEMARVVAGYEVVQKAAETLVNSPVAPPLVEAVAPSLPEATPSLVETPLTGHLAHSPLIGAEPEPPLEVPVSTHANPSIAVSISEKGEGAIKLFTHLQESLKEQGLTPENTASDSDAHYILTHTADQAALNYKFWTSEGSRIMHVGDTFIVDEQGHFVSDVSSEKFIPSPQAPEAAALEPAPEVSSPEVVPELAAEPVVAPMPELISATDHDIETYPTPPPIETMSVTDIFTTSSEVLPAISADQRLGLLNLIKMHGVGPGEGETVADFTARVENAPLIGKIVSGYRGLQVPLGETHIYRNVHDHLVVFGGDTSAQATVMVEYLRAHPGQSVFQGSVGNDGVSHLLPYQLSNNKLIVSGLGVREPSWLERRLGFSGSLAEGPKPGDLKATVF